MQTDQPTTAATPRTGERRQHSKQFKAEAVRLVKEGGRSYPDVAQSLDLDTGLLRKWAKALDVQGTRCPRHSMSKALDVQGAEAFRGHGQRTALEQEAHDLRQQNRRLREENDILKKAARYFAANPS